MELPRDNQAWRASTLRRSQVKDLSSFNSVLEAVGCFDFSHHSFHTSITTAPRSAVLIIRFGHFFSWTFTCQLRKRKNDLNPRTTSRQPLLYTNDKFLTSFFKGTLPILEIFPRPLQTCTAQIHRRAYQRLDPHNLFDRFPSHMAPSSIHSSSLRRYIFTPRS